METQTKILDAAGVEMCAANEPETTPVESREMWDVAVIMHDGEGPLGAWHRVWGKVPMFSNHRKPISAAEAAEVLAESLNEDGDELGDNDTLPVAVRLNDTTVACFRVRLRIVEQYSAEFRTGKDLTW